MSCAGRFRDSEGDGFPPVTNYDYPSENLPVRGVEDRTFRWQEVCVPDLWLFEEITSNGGFEGSSATGWALLTIGGQDTSTFTGWTLSGDRTWRLNQTGHTYVSGEIPGFLDSFTAYSISEVLSVGIWPVTGNVQVHRDLGSLEQDETFQAYAEVHSTYGASGNVRMFVEGRTTSPVAYFNPSTLQWQSSRPTGSMFVLNSGAHNQLKFDFSTAGYPGTTPTGFRIIVESDTTGHFYTLDEVHVDQYQAKNAFLEFVLPESYLLQITPDLGWHDVPGMFEDLDSKNPHLTTLGPFSISSATLVDERDGSVSVEINKDQIREATSRNYRNYLWRAIAVSPNGVLGDGGVPARFDYIGSILESEFSVDKIHDDPLSYIKIIEGTRTPRISVLVDGVEHPGIEYPTDTTWKLTFVMSAGRHEIVIQGVDQGGVKTSSQILELESTVYKQNESSLWNVFDEHGLMMDITRLPGEANKELAARIKDVGRNPGGFSFAGVVNGAVRELSLKKISDGISFSHPVDIYSRSHRDPLDIQVTSSSIRIRTRSMRRTERHRVDPVHGTVDLEKRPYELPENTQVDDSVEDEPFIYRIYFEDESLHGTLQTITYEYQEELLFRDYPTVGQMVTGLNSLLDPTGLRVVISRLSPLLSGNEACFGLFLSRLVVNPGKVVLLSWSPFFLRRISDRTFRSHFRNQDGSYWNTDYYRFVQELKANSNSFWGHIEVDIDFWDGDDNSREGFDTVPTLFDPPLAHYYSSPPNIHRSDRLDAAEAFGRRFKGYSGEFVHNLSLQPEHFQEGVGYRADLRVTPSITSTEETAIEAEDPVIVPLLRDNHGMLFSGQL